MEKHREESENSSACLFLKYILSHFSLFQQTLWVGPRGQCVSWPKCIYSPGTPGIAHTQVSVSFSTNVKIFKFSPALRTWRYLNYVGICKKLRRQCKGQRCGWVGFEGNVGPDNYKISRTTALQMRTRETAREHKYSVASLTQSQKFKPCQHS